MFRPAIPIGSVFGRKSNKEVYTTISKILDQRPNVWFRQASADCRQPRNRKKAPFDFRIARYPTMIGLTAGYLRPAGHIAHVKLTQMAGTSVVFQRLSGLWIV